MKWVVDRETIVEALSSLISVIEKASISPITTNIKLQLSGNSLGLVATDTKLQIKCLLDLPSDQDFEQTVATTVSAQKLFDSCSSSKSTEIVFDLKDDKLQLSFENGKFSLHTLPADQFPEIQEPKTSSSLSLPQSVWKELMKSTVFAVAERDHREALRGLLLEVEQSTIRLVGTDGHRLAIAETEAEGALEGELKKTILPRKSVLEMQRLFSDSDELLTLSFSGNSHVSFKLEHNHIMFTSNLIEAEYPNYQKAIPENNQNTLTVDRLELCNALSRAVVLQRDLPRTVILKLQKESLTVSCTNSEGEEAELILPAQFDAENLEIAFNENYLQGALKVLNEEEIRLNVGEANQSILIKESKNKVTRSNIIMPLNI